MILISSALKVDPARKLATAVASTLQNLVDELSNEAGSPAQTEDELVAAELPEPADFPFQIVDSTEQIINRAVEEILELSTRLELSANEAIYIILDETYEVLKNRCLNHGWLSTLGTEAFLPNKALMVLSKLVDELVTEYAFGMKTDDFLMLVDSCSTMRIEFAERESCNLGGILLGRYFQLKGLKETTLLCCLDAFAHHVPEHLSEYRLDAIAAFRISNDQMKNFPLTMAAKTEAKPTLA